jgi:hypothetical protein
MNKKKPTSPYENQYGVSSKKFKTGLPYDPAIPILVCTQRDPSQLTIEIPAFTCLSLQYSK